ncbi:hypothetical protein M9458_053520, partial [Cirrhinus mrigala]
RRENTAADFQQTRKKMPLLESTCCMNCHRLLQRIVVLETKLLAGLTKQAEHSADRRHRPPQHTDGESREPSESQQFISVEEQAETDRHTNRWHKQGARHKGPRDIRLSRVSRIAAVTSSTPDMAMIRLAKTGVLPPPIQLENRFEALMNVGEESPNVTEHGSYEPAANIATDRRSRWIRQQHSAQSAAEPRTLIVGDSIIRNISSRTTTTCCFPQATVSDVNKELRDILMKHKTANQIIIHVGKNDIQKEQSELLKKDFSELIETLQPFSRSSVDHSQEGELTCFQVECASPPNMNDTHTPGQSMSDHRTSHQLQSHHVVDTSHKDTDNATQPQQALLMDTIPAEPCPLSSSQTDCDVLQQLQDSAPKDNFLANSQESQENIFQPPETPEPEPRSPDTLSLSPASPVGSGCRHAPALPDACTSVMTSFAVYFIFYFTLYIYYFFSSNLSTFYNSSQVVKTRKKKLNYNITRNHHLHSQLPATLLAIHTNGSCKSSVGDKNKTRKSVATEQQNMNEYEYEAEYEREIMKSLVKCFPPVENH